MNANALPGAATPAASQAIKPFVSVVSIIETCPFYAFSCLGSTF